MFTDHKTCFRCNANKHISFFYRDKSMKDGLASRCKECRTIGRVRDWKANPHRDKWRRVLSKHGLTESDYNKLLLLQNGVCAICKKEDDTTMGNGDIRSLSIDHCHTTLKVRGLLCNRCNTGLGLFKDNIESLKNAISYLL